MRNWIVAVKWLLVITIPISLICGVATVIPRYLGSWKLSSALKGNDQIHITSFRLFSGGREFSDILSKEELQQISVSFSNSEYHGCSWGGSTVTIEIKFENGGFYRHVDGSYGNGILSIKDVYSEAAEPLWPTHFVYLPPEIARKINGALFQEKEEKERRR